MENKPDSNAEKNYMISLFLHYITKSFFVENSFFD